jgi:hypothetical protein
MDRARVTWSQTAETPVTSVSNLAQPLHIECAKGTCLSVHVGTQSSTMPSAFFPKHDRTESNNGIPIFEAIPITRVFREVPLAKGGGTVPVQFQYSNAVHGPQGAD